MKLELAARANLYAPRSGVAGMSVRRNQHGARGQDPRLRRAWNRVGPSDSANDVAGSGAEHDLEFPRRAISQINLGTLHRLPAHRNRLHVHIAFGESS